MQLARVDRSTTPATIELPREYNAALEFIDANLAKGRAEKPPSSTIPAVTPTASWPSA